MAEKSEFELVVSEGKKSIPEIILASVFYAVLVYLVLMALYDIFIERSLLLSMVTFFQICYKGAPSLAMALTFSVTKTVLIDTDKNKLISRYCVGPFSRDVVSEVPQLEYVAVFLDAKSYFQVNLWYKGNKHYTMFYFEEKEPAMTFAEAAADKLKIDLLDATEKGNSKWIEKVS